MKEAITRIPAVPLITNDPFFSVWSAADKLHDTMTTNWTGAKQPITGTVSIDGTDYLFLGEDSAKKKLKQTGLDITPTSSIYTFTGAGILFTVTFTSPLLLTDLELVSRPCSYITFTALSTDASEHALTISLTFDESHCHNSGITTHFRSDNPWDDNKPAPMEGGVHTLSFGNTAWMGKRTQAPLSQSGDGVTIDWGYLYLTVPAGMGQVAKNTETRTVLTATLPLTAGEEESSVYVVASYDDIAAINYFGALRPAYWARNGKTILTAIQEAVGDYKQTMSKCSIFDTALLEEALAVGGEDYQLLCATAYRQTIAAHKLITDLDDKPIFLSKENYSNGCIGTVDVSYPSTPLYLLFAPELVKGMLLPIFKFSRMPVWEYDFAPHDIGRYPYATGQVYGSKSGPNKNGQTVPPYYTYPAGSDEYQHHMQMPVEESGNMLIMSAMVALLEDDSAFLEENIDLLEQWTTYLIEQGENPGNQLCTDDFAGHLAQNINLSAKAIMGVEAYSIILELLGRSNEAAAYHRKAQAMADSWVARAESDEATYLTFDKIGWSLKYNLVWDILFDSQLFPDELFEAEVDWYIAQRNKYGTPLDTRNTYTKSDWILWAASLTDDPEKREALIAPIAEFLRNSPDRVAFSDWYDTKTGKVESFVNRTVQGGLFMPMLRSRLDAFRHRGHHGHGGHSH